MACAAAGRQRWHVLVIGLQVLIPAGRCCSLFFKADAGAIIAAKPSGSNVTIRAGYGYGPTVEDLDDESQIVDDHIHRSLNEIRGGGHGLSRGHFTATVQRRADKEIGPGFPVGNRIDEILDTFMSRDDSA